MLSGLVIQNVDAVLSEGIRISLAVWPFALAPPETDRFGASGHVVPVDVVGIGDPERRRRVVGGDQDILGGLAVRSRSTGSRSIRSQRPRCPGRCCRDW